MGKAILIVDMPSKYDEDIQNGRVMIDYSLWHLDHKFKAEQNFHSAPLKPMPSKMESTLIFNGEKVESAYVGGWNDCIDEILGDEE